MKKYLLILVGITALLPSIVLAKNIENEVLVSSTTKYYKTVYTDVVLMSLGESYGTTIEISKDEYENNSLIEPFATITTEYKKLTTNLYSSGSAYKYEVVLDWRKMPKARSYDIIGIGFYNSVTVDGSLNFSQRYCTSTSSCTTSKKFTGKVDSFGASAVFKIPSGTFSSLTQKLSFKVKKAGNYTIVDQIASGDYSHAQSSITESLAKEHTMHHSEGIVLSANAASKYDEIRPAVATWNGTW